jgi:hypothetical protein
VLAVLGGEFVGQELESVGVAVAGRRQRGAGCEQMIACQARSFV